MRPLAKETSQTPSLFMCMCVCGFAGCSWFCFVQGGKWFPAIIKIFSILEPFCGLQNTSSRPYTHSHTSCGKKNRKVVLGSNISAGKHGH